MRVIREVNGFTLNEGFQAASGLYNVSFEPLLNTSPNGVSKWLGEEEKNELIQANDESFQALCLEYITEINFGVVIHS